MKLKIITAIMILCVSLSMGCTEYTEEYTEEEKEGMRESFASEMVVLIYDMPMEPSISGINYDFVDNPTVEDCDNWILDAENHLKDAKEYRKIIFVDTGNKYDERKYDEYFIRLEEHIIEVEGYKGKAKVYEEISIMYDESTELTNNESYLLYDYKEGKITREELYVGIFKSSTEKREIWINIRNIAIENENGYFNKSDESLEFIKGCDDMIEAIVETMFIVSE